MPYILISKDGGYVSSSWVMTHLGPRTRFSLVDDINKATLFRRGIKYVFAGVMGTVDMVDVIQVPAKETRVVEVITNQENK